MPENKVSAEATPAPISAMEKRARLKEILRKKREGGGASAHNGGMEKPQQKHIDTRHYHFDQDPDVVAHRAQHTALAKLKLNNPFFVVNQGIARGTTQIDGQEYINYANYNYLGLSGDQRVTQAAIEALETYGTSVSASRIASGERPVQRDLETELAKVYQVEDCAVFVSGFATNVTVIGHLFGPNDLILHDELAHNSAIQGALLSNAKRISFPHNDTAALARLLAQHRDSHERVLIFIEGVYSMDGDIADLQKFVALKKKFKTYLMVDEAHSFGVLGARGYGLREHFEIAGTDVDIWMGTLSKTLASCGGYIAGSGALIEYLKYTAPGFLYSVGITPPNAAASLAALKIMEAEPDRVATVCARADQFRELAAKSGLDIGMSQQGSAVIPIVVGNSMLSIALSNALFAKGINVQPVLYPAVEEDAARLRFFITSAHTEAQVVQTVEIISDEFSRLKEAVQ
ncbi:MAG: aminotransferase class I/II-fold pyridoxal phosphate-dependent enzyme [Rhodobacterales bacterium]|nr:aminotransferase class I/II-fold pyridoxal phosphate-dependent enzyme [Rhodobacterales bacterium]